MSAKRRAAAQMPFHGYLSKILTRQGKHAPGGKHNYISNGQMIGGFALVAWPADYGDSGIMTPTALGRCQRTDRSAQRLGWNRNTWAP
jgi:Protein of unknown function (DUF2950)